MVATSIDRLFDRLLPRKAYHLPGGILMGLSVARLDRAWLFGLGILHLTKIPWCNQRRSATVLRCWRRRALQQPALLFPEGNASLQFGTVRQGCGRLLRSLGVPVLPTAVWWNDGQWHVRVGSPIEWSGRPELLELQLGLNVAALLPRDLVESWIDRLALWHAAHSVGAATPRA